MRQSRCRCGRDEPSPMLIGSEPGPGADVAGASCPDADVAGASPIPVRMWQECVQSRCRFQMRCDVLMQNPGTDRQPGAHVICSSSFFSMSCTIGPTGRSASGAKNPSECPVDTVPRMCKIRSASPTCAARLGSPLPHLHRNLALAHLATSAPGLGAPYCRTSAIRRILFARCHVSADAAQSSPRTSLYSAVVCRWFRRSRCTRSSMLSPGTWSECAPKCHRRLHGSKM